jgi:hypothetical protein
MVLAQFMEDRLRPRWIQRACTVVIVVCAGLFALSFATAHRGQTIFGPALGADFAAFYTAGVLIDEGARGGVYDFWANYRRLHELFPTTPADEALPFAYPPFFAATCAPLARLPYPVALAIWMIGSLGALVAGFMLVSRAPASRLDRTAALLVLLSFEPVLIECLVGGQTSAIGFCALAACVGLARSRRPVCAGLALSVLCYKPTLLLLVLPMLVVTAQIRVLAGFAAGAVALAGASVAAVGWDGCVTYARLLAGYAGDAAGPQTVFRTWKFVDARSFFRLLFGGRAALAAACTAVTFAAAAPFLVRFWRRCRDTDHLWAATLVWTMVLNVYVPIYDTALVGLAMLLLAPRHGRAWTPAMKALVLFAWVCPWVTQHIAASVGFQPFTLVLAGLGVYLVRHGSAAVDETGASLGLASPVGIIRPLSTFAPNR